MKLTITPIERHGYSTLCLTVEVADGRSTTETVTAVDDHFMSRFDQMLAVLRRRALAQLGAETV